MLGGTPPPSFLVRPNPNPQPPAAPVVHPLNAASPSSPNDSIPQLLPRPPQPTSPPNLAPRLPSPAPTPTPVGPPSASQDRTSKKATLDLSRSRPNPSLRGGLPRLFLRTSKGIDPFRLFRRSVRWRTEVAFCLRSTRMGGWGTIGGLISRSRRGGGSERKWCRRVEWVLLCFLLSFWFRFLVSLFIVALP
ncbi:hypothetical protein BDY24DRAFT_376355 [Mrakia frigida]|uniref:uncharacterized protein n=1 Tax=Mrakia frigida TaxID=29902 RepID=UPI003FCC2149